jgi:hypothetical protein
MLRFLTATYGTACSYKVYVGGLVTIETGSAVYVVTVKISYFYGPMHHFCLRDMRRGRWGHAYQRPTSRYHRCLPVSITSSHPWPDLLQYHIVTGQIRLRVPSRQLTSLHMTRLDQLPALSRRCRIMDQDLPHMEYNVISFATSIKV